MDNFERQAFIKKSSGLVGIWTRDLLVKMLGHATTTAVPIISITTVPPCRKSNRVTAAEIFSRSVLATTPIAAPAFLESKTLSSLPTSPRHRKKSLERKLCRRIVRKEESARERERESGRRESLTDLRIQGSYPPTPPSPTPFFPLLSIDWSKQGNDQEKKLFIFCWDAFQRRFFDLR